MRIFELAPGMSTAFHTHDWEHELFVLSGEGALVEDKKETPLKPEDVVFVPANEKHSFSNKGNSTFRIICVVPTKGEDTP